MRRGEPRRIAFIGILTKILYFRLVLIFQKQFYDFRVKMRAGILDDTVHRFVVGHGFAVRAVGGQRIPNIRHSEDTRGLWDRSFLLTRAGSRSRPIFHGGSKGYPEPVPGS